MKIYLVGGAVRDFVLKINNTKDKDWVVVGGSPDYFLNNGYQQVGKDFPVFLHPETNEEYALARIERKTGTGHQGFSCYAEPNVTLEQDLSRRDLTINAMAMDDTNNIIDPFNGMSDCSTKTLRHVSHAFVEDPLRCLRLARFAAQLPGFKVAPETLKLCQQMVADGAINDLSKPRIWQEWHKALKCSDPNRFFEVMSDIGGLDNIQHLEFSKLTTAAERFALFCSNYNAASSIISVTAPPKSYEQLAKLLIKSQKADEPKTSEQIFNLLSMTDAFRRPELLHSWLKVAQVSPKFAHWCNFEKINDAFIAASNINIAKIVSSGELSGKEIGLAIDAARIAAIKKILK